MIWITLSSFKYPKLIFYIYYYECSWFNIFLALLLDEWVIKYYLVDLDEFININYESWNIFASYWARNALAGEALEVVHLLLGLFAESELASEVLYA